MCTIKLNAEQAEVLRLALERVTAVDPAARYNLPLPGTHDHAILEGVLHEIKQDATCARP